MKKVTIILLITLSGLVLHSQDNSLSEIKIKISVDSLKKIDTSIHISSDIDHDEIQKKISEISMSIKDHDFINSYIINAEDSIFDIDIDVNIEGLDAYIDSVFTKEFENLNFEFEFSDKFEDEIQRSLKKQIIIEKSDNSGEGEHIIIMKSPNGVEEKIIIKSDDLDDYMKKKDSDIEKEDDGAVK
ncbi:hypothetical protein ACFLTE_00145 [Bacteroidota bacterium]